MRHLVFWQNVLSPHHAGLMASLARRADVSVTWIAREPMIARRTAMGWQDAAVDGVEHIIDPTTDRIDALCDPAARERIHIHTGLLPLGYRKDPLALVQDRGLTWGTVLERGRQTGVKAPLARMRYRLLALRLARSMTVMLAMGRIGAHWYAATGWPARKIFPFAYFPEPIERHRGPADEADGPHRILYLGALVDYKSVCTLIAALPRLRAGPWSLTIVGDGPLRGALMDQARTLGMMDRIIWRGSLPRDEALATLARHDVMVLPSRTDGWGAVVNEGLMMGVPVIASSGCGASDLIGVTGVEGASWRGGLFAPLDAAGLARRLDAEIAAGRPGRERRERIAQWAAALHGEGPATYLHAILDHVLDGGQRPTPPWQGEDGEARSGITHPMR
ncbi:MAG: glycosyltransferase family 4 protein [Alphaproteobacteria bacterium]